MRQVLNVEKHNYEIVITDISFEDFKSEINDYLKDKKCLYVVSKRVYGLYAKVLGLNKEEVFILNDGEKEKNFKNYIKILERAEKLGLTRSDTIVAIGGGVVGDITGFVASTYMRGINYIQVPTTLLAMVDSSVGGKTAVDMFGIKNLVGSFYQPKKVFINANFLKTLDKKQYLSGLGEVLKYAFIEANCSVATDLYLYEYLLLTSQKILARDNNSLIRLIEYCLTLKSAVVSKDEKESGLRRILNLGHTFGHALEARTNYKKFTHGEAVVQGLYFILDWAVSKQIITASYYRMSLDLLNKYGFNRSKLVKEYPALDLLKFMQKDKKALNDKILFIVPCDKKLVKEVCLTQEQVLEMFDVVSNL